MALPLDNASNRSRLTGAVWARQDGSLLVYPPLPEAGDDIVISGQGPGLAPVHDSQHRGETTATDALGGTLRQGWTVEGLPAWRELPDCTREDSVPKHIQPEAYDCHGNVIVDTMLDAPAHDQQHCRRRGLLP
ncbi:hypothetical protein RGF97_33155 [Streptomyces roseicoloratus]|uniref:Uncharacterized protein n=1 Tax=Streptomyces roseicoloratus TaxID=2508722 RepID=A0ABY9RN16_9ACTN|nr:hypothetical protein [Streptomyces roseicoloratus]WMX43600.1 hypothetical protein RGF97_00115 [Streptomyces roseicoloratus]WMX48676.1 hypothetical protein RGF97_33155 [Streptomyces roseicoloratus]